MTRCIHGSEHALKFPLQKKEWMMSDREIEKARIRQIRHAMSEKNKGDKYFSYAPIVWDALTPPEREVLNQLLHQGPVWDGNIISKSHRDNLIEYGLAVRCCYMGEQGYTAAAYYALTVFKAGKAKPFARKQGIQG